MTRMGHPWETTIVLNLVELQPKVGIRNLCSSCWFISMVCLKIEYPKVILGYPRHCFWRTYRCHGQKMAPGVWSSHRLSGMLPMGLWTPNFDGKMDQWMSNTCHTENIPWLSHQYLSHIPFTGPYPVNIIEYPTNIPPISRYHLDPLVN